MLSTTSPEPFSPSAWLAQRLAEEEELLREYDTPQKVYELALSIQADYEPVVSRDDVFDGSGSLGSPYQERTFQEILEQAEASSEEIAYIQARALSIAGYEVRLVSVPVGTDKGVRKISFATFYDPETQSWRAIAN